MDRVTGMIAALALCLAPAVADQLPIVIDGRFEEWTVAGGVDPAGDGGSSGIDILEVWAADDAQHLFIGFQLSSPLLLNTGHDLTLYLDTDDDPLTGLSRAGIGAELEWRFGDRDGTVYVGGSSQFVEHDDISFLAAPAVTSVRFELAIRRDTEPGGSALFTGDTVRLVLRDEASGDQFPNLPGGWPTVMTARGLSSGPELLIDRELATDVRVVSYNVLSDAPWEGGAARIGRQLAAVAADVYCFQEIYDHSASETEAFVSDWVDPPIGASWHSVGHADCKIVSRFSLLDEWSLSGNLAALLDTAGALPGPLLVINAHLPCCANDSGRQQEIDEILEFIRDQQGPGGVITAEPDTALVILGDLNLVGLVQQLTSLMEGDIVDEAAHGPDVILDADGTNLTDAVPRQVAERMAYTWRNDSSSFWPGRLDYVIYSDSLIEAARKTVLYTPDLSAATLSAHGLQALDSLASDHAMVTVDFRANAGPIPPDFIRSDCTGDGAINLPDAIRLLGVVFGEYPAVCDDACDSDDNGILEVTDAILLLIYLFQGGALPSPMGCSADGSPDSLACAVAFCP